MTQQLQNIIDIARRVNALVAQARREPRHGENAQRDQDSARETIMAHQATPLHLSRRVAGTAPSLVSFHRHIMSCCLL